MKRIKSSGQQARKGVDPKILRKGFAGEAVSDDGDPSDIQTEQQIADYYLNVKAGDHASVRYEDSELLRFTLVKIDSINPRLGRLYVVRDPSVAGSSFYRKTGKSCFRPRERYRLVVPTAEVAAWVVRNPDGSRMRSTLLEKLRPYLT